MNDGSKKRTRGRPKTFDRARTLQITVDSYWRDGVDGVSVNEICRRAAVSKPGLYREFGGEDRLMDAALHHYADTVLMPAFAMLSQDQPFRDTLDALVDFATRETASDLPTGCLFVKMSASRHRLGPITRDHLDRLQQQAIAAYAGWLERASAQGEIALTVPLQVAATYVDAQLTMLLTRIGAGEDRDIARAHAGLAFAVLTGGVA